MFSCARNSCYRNHDRYTLCAYHKNNEHNGEWQNCEKCKKDIDTEMYVWYGTNDYNLEKLKDPFKFKPTQSSQCGIIIKRGYEGCTGLPNGKFLCDTCGTSQFTELVDERLSN